jgi:hypothetical protein
MAVAVKKVGPGIWLALGAVLVAGLAVAVKRAVDFDVDLDLDWDNLPA